MPTPEYLDELRAGLDQEITDLSAQIAEAEGPPAVEMSSTRLSDTEDTDSQPAPPPAPKKPRSDGATTVKQQRPRRTQQGRRAWPPPEEVKAPARPRKSKDAATQPPDVPTLPSLPLDVMRSRVLFLNDMRKRIDKDPELLNFVDTMINNRVREAERRQRVFSTAVTTAVSIVSLIAGWILSSINPASAMAHLLH